MRTVSGTTPTPRVGVTSGSYPGIVARIVAHQSSGTGGLVHRARVGEVAGLGGDHERAVRTERVEQSFDDGDRAAVDPSEGPERRVREEGLAGAHAERAQVRREGGSR